MDALEWIANSGLAAAMKGSVNLYIAVSAAHILSVGLIVGAILPLDLKLIGLFPRVPLAVIGPFLSRIAATGIVLAIVTGGLLFSVRPTEYAGNPAFLAKLALLLAGVVNAVLLHGSAGWRNAVGGAPVTPVLRLQASLSLAIWIAALAAGRWIGFL